MGMETVFSAAQKLKERGAKVDEAVSKATGTAPTTGNDPVPEYPSSATGYAGAKATEHTGSKGEKAYGAPLGGDDREVDSAIMEAVEQIRGRQHAGQTGEGVQPMAGDDRFRR